MLTVIGRRSFIGRLLGNGLTGTAVGISQGGLLTQLEHEIEVSCLPIDLPESIEVDITDVEMDGAILVKDLVVPENVKITSDPEMLILHVSPPKTQEVEEDVDAADGEADGENADSKTDAEESKE